MVLRKQDMTFPVFPYKNDAAQAETSKWMHTEM